MKRHQFRFLEKENIGGETWRFVFETDELIAARPGQFFIFHWAEGLQRSYSIGNIVEGPSRRFDFFIALVPDGTGSEFLRKLSEGDEVEVAGPSGRFAIRDFTRPHVLIGTGTGIAPFYSALLHLERLTNNGKSVTVISGARTRAELLFDAFWRGADVDYVACVSRVDEQDCVHGRVQNALFEKDINLNAVYLLCGNPEMVADVKKRLQEEGVPRPQIRTESYT